ncbi:hypothetical protein BDW59DRAFT_156134 [Aspergillus cavernicola]|uniref:Uncharacterized protein n=1 Tax=Aspergillus cavernicola TaxID=176166 RepID=A0ABR4J555_9EURO
MCEWCSYLTFDIMCDFVFGGSYNLLEREDNCRVVNDIKDANLRAAVLVWAPYLYLDRLDKIRFKDSKDSENNRTTGRSSQKPAS